jgi:hypothetical protein
MAGCLPNAVDFRDDAPWTPLPWREGPGEGVDIAQFFTPTLPPPSKGEELKVNSIGVPPRAGRRDGG